MASDWLDTHAHMRSQPPPHTHTHCNFCRGIVGEFGELASFRVFYCGSWFQTVSTKASKGEGRKSSSTHATMNHHMQAYVCTCTHVNMCTCVHMHSTCVHMQSCMHMCTLHNCTCIHMHAHVHTHTSVCAYRSNPHPHAQSVAPLCHATNACLLCGRSCAHTYAHCACAHVSVRTHISTDSTPPPHAQSVAPLCHAAYTCSMCGNHFKSSGELAKHFEKLHAREFKKKTSHK